MSLSYEDGRPVEGKGVGRKVIDRVQETYDSELNGKDFAYDGEKTLFTLGTLARNKLEFTVVLEDVTSNRLKYVWLLILQIGFICTIMFLQLIFFFSFCLFYRNNGNCSPDGHGSPNESDKKRMRRPYRAKTFKVEISYAAKIPLQAISNALKGQESENFQEAIRVLDIILRQHAAKQCVNFAIFFLFFH